MPWLCHFLVHLMYLSLSGPLYIVKYISSILIYIIVCSVIICYTLYLWQVSHLQQLEQEAENVREAEVKVKAELSALQAQLANCEEQLAARKQTVRSAQ